MAYNFDEMLSSLKKLVAIDSVEKQSKPNMPFGEGVAAALNYTLSLAESFGFETVNYDNFIGEIIFKGDKSYNQNDRIAILAHLDVVPVGKLSDWKFPPFTPTLYDGKLFGRGTVDDKGPLVATLYALKRLKDEGFIPSKQINFILGCDEESGWRCIEHYKEKATLPETGFSPDASFPVLYAEKGIYYAKYYFDYDSSKLFEFQGGLAANVVCDYAYIKAEKNQPLIEKFQLKLNGDIIENFGKTAHGSEPQKGVNALYNLVCYLEEIGAIKNEIRRFLFDDELKLKQLHDETGFLTLSPDMVSIEDGKLCFTVDVRYPSTLDFKPISEKLHFFSDVVEIEHQLPLFNDKQSPLIQTLLKVYNKHSHSDCKPIAIGGGTYARALKLGAGFGPEDDSEPYTAHQPNEFISLDKLKFIYEVYYDAIKELCK